MPRCQAGDEQQDQRCPYQNSCMIEVARMRQIGILNAKLFCLLLSPDCGSGFPFLLLLTVLDYLQGDDDSGGSSSDNSEDDDDDDDEGRKPRVRFAFSCRSQSP